MSAPLDIEAIRARCANMLRGDAGANAEFLAWVHEDIPALLAEVERLRKALYEAGADLHAFAAYVEARPESDPTYLKAIQALLTIAERVDGETEVSA